MMERMRARRMERRVEERGIREPKMMCTARAQKMTERMKRMRMVRLLIRCSGGASGSSNSSVGCEALEGGDGERTV